MRYYTFLFKVNPTDGWSITEQFVARNDNEAWECAMRWAENNGYCDLTMM